MVKVTLNGHGQHYQATFIGRCTASQFVQSAMQAENILEIVVECNHLKQIEIYKLGNEKWEKTMFVLVTK